MKISTANTRKFDQTEQDRADLFNFDHGVDSVATQEGNRNFIVENPVAAAMAAMVAVGAPIAGIAMNDAIQTHAAELPQNQDVQATYVENSEVPGANITETVEEIQTKVINFTVDGSGHIEPGENCTINGETGEITFENSDENAGFYVVSDVEGATSTISMGGYVMPSGTDYVMLEAHSEYATINVSFDASAVEEQTIAEEAVVEENEAAAAEAAAQVQAQQAAQQQVVRTTVVNNGGGAAPAQQSAPAPVQQTQVVTHTVQQAPAQQQQQAVNTTPRSGAAAHSMNGAEMAEARQIFDAYNDYRASKGLNRVAWSDDCANMAYGSAIGCAASGKLVHKLGIPGAVQSNYSDILQYSTWKMSGQDAVKRWSQSNGHRKMMQCDSAQVAGVAAYNNGGTWYYAIVYNFQGTNQSGA